MAVPGTLNFACLANQLLKVGCDACQGHDLGFFISTPLELHIAAFQSAGADGDPEGNADQVSIIKLNTGRL